MNSPTIKTATLGLLAAVVCAAASFFYPWPQQIQRSELVGKPLFEAYDTGKVRSIRIAKFNDEKSGLDRIQLRRVGEKWVMPNNRDFVADNGAQCSITTGCLNELEVLEEKTSNQQDHIEFSVVDPIDYEKTPNRAALGRKVILEDRQGRQVASLIVGKKVSENPQDRKFYVRKPGQPTVFVCNFNPQALQTDFEAWVDPNLFDLRFNAARPNRIIRIVVENYRMAPEDLERRIQLNYRCKLNVGQASQLNLLELEKGTAQGWAEAALSPQVAEQLQPVKQVAQVMFSDVRRKQPEVATVLETPNQNVKDSIFDSLKSFGFVKTGFNYENYDFDGVGGEVLLETEDAVVVRMTIGGIAKETNTSGRLQLNRYCIMTAGVNESLLPTPTKPEPVDDKEKADQQEKEYLRLVKARADKIKAAKRRAAELNQQYADWVYVIAEDIISNLRPDVDMAAVVMKPAATNSETSKPASTEAKKAESSSGKAESAEPVSEPNESQSNEPAPSNGEGAAAEQKATQGDSKPAAKSEEASELGKADPEKESK